MKPKDFNEVYRIDVLTQKEYLSASWNSMGKDAQNTHLVSKSPTFIPMITTGFSQVATQKGIMKGFLLAYADSADKKAVIVKYIAVDLAYRRKRVGVALYDGLIKTAKKLGKRKIIAYINTDNPTSIKLHRKLGFSIVPRIEAILTL